MSQAVKLLGMSILWKIFLQVSSFKSILDLVGSVIFYLIFQILNKCLILLIDDKSRILAVLDKVKELKHPNILTCIHYLVKEKELVMITELITAGSIRE